MKFGHCGWPLRFFDILGYILLYSEAAWYIKSEFHKLPCRYFVAICNYINQMCLMSDKGICGSWVIQEELSWVFEYPFGGCWWRVLIYIQTM